MTRQELKARIEYNSHDLGEFGKVIKLEYLENILNDLYLTWNDDPTGGLSSEALSSAENEGML